MEDYAVRFANPVVYLNYLTDTVLEHKNTKHYNFHIYLIANNYHGIIHTCIFMHAWMYVCKYICMYACRVRTHT